MSKEDFNFEIPATFEMTVWLKDDEKELIGKASVSFSSGKYPTKKEIRKWIKKTVEETGMELCSPHEFGRAMLKEETGQNFAIPGPDKWDVDFAS